MASLVGFFVTLLVTLFVFGMLFCMVLFVIQWCSPEDDVALRTIMQRHRERRAAVRAGWQPERERITDPNAPCRQPNCRCCGSQSRRTDS